MAYRRWLLLFFLSGIHYFLQAQSFEIVDGKKIIAIISVPDDKFPWIDDHEFGSDDLRYYDLKSELFVMIEDQPRRFGVNLTSKTVDFMFLEGADLDIITLFKLRWT